MLVLIGVYQGRELHQGRNVATQQFGQDSGSKYWHNHPPGERESGLYGIPHVIAPVLSKYYAEEHYQKVALDGH